MFYPIFDTYLDPYFITKGSWVKRGLAIFFQIWLKFHNPTDINSNKVDFLQLCQAPGEKGRHLVGHSKLREIRHTPIRSATPTLWRLEHFRSLHTGYFSSELCFFSPIKPWWLALQVCIFATQIVLKIKERAICKPKEQSVHSMAKGTLNKTEKTRPKLP